jgi:hypothetical protein
MCSPSLDADHVVGGDVQFEGEATIGLSPDDSERHIAYSRRSPNLHDIISAQIMSRPETWASAAEILANSVSNKRYATGHLTRHEAENDRASSTAAPR